ncbi:biotin synthase [Listeria grandensis]|uniref:Biotin synthase n=1 Tax=Listeria grandensis TaxID=1494963 RepID=A0A7X0Y475_9LIST|nr:radical SAM protein [Listeria grandensis]MBC1936706.1 biotin synthase [Listeria grandensis]
MSNKTENINLKEINRIKVEILANGINYDDAFIVQYNQDETTLQKRRAYGNSDEVIRSNVKVPQEIVLPGNIVVATNQRSSSSWNLDYKDGKYIVHDNETVLNVNFPVQPKFYDYYNSEKVKLDQLITLYGGSTLGVFSPGTCYFWGKKLECKFCSLQPTRAQLSNHKIFIEPDKVVEATQLALTDKTNEIKHFLLNGGTISDYDKGFKKHLAILEAVNNSGILNEVPMHLISMPPKDLTLFKELARLEATIAMDIEVFDPELFNDICPGKSKDYGRENFIHALTVAVDYMGEGNVYCGFVAGLEPIDSFIEGLYFMADKGVVPAVNIFHNDPESQFKNHSRPSIEYINEVGKHMAIIYKKYNYKPFLEGSGRNAVDTEAYRQLF